MPLVRRSRPSSFAGQHSKNASQPFSLRAYLKKLPDFDDVEAEERAMRHALDFRSFPAALDFLRGWPDQARAARLVLTRATEIDGNLYYLLNPTAQLLEGKHPLPATLLLRAMIEDTLNGAKFSRYKHAARHLPECLSLASSIQDFENFETHETFASRLHAQAWPKDWFLGSVMATAVRGKRFTRSAAA